MQLFHVNVKETRYAAKCCVLVVFFFVVVVNSLKKLLLWTAFVAARRTEIHGGQG